MNVVNKNYFVAEIDSTTLANLADPYVKVKNKLNKTSIDFRVVATNEFDEHSMDVAMTPTGSFDWPSRRSFVAAVRGSWGFLADVVATGKLISPDGSVKGFALHDDGLNGDYLAGDGVYFADLPSISQNGTYQWEISMSNKGGTAHTTRIGTSLPDTIPFVEKTDATPFELFRNGQFVVSGCCSDEPTSDLVELYPEKRVNAYLQSGSDEDRFKIAGTLSGKSYALYLSSRNLDFFDNVKVYSPTDLTTPVYVVNVEPKSGYDFISVPLSSEYAMPGFVVAVRFDVLPSSSVNVFVESLTENVTLSPSTVTSQYAALPPAEAVTLVVPSALPLIVTLLFVGTIETIESLATDQVTVGVELPVCSTVAIISASSLISSVFAVALREID